MIKRSYWDIDDILAEEESVTIKVTKDFEGLGFLNPVANDINLKKSSRLAVPLWLGSLMAMREMVNIEVPKFYGESYRNTLEADPRIISLKERSNYFFEVGGKLSSLLEGANLIELLLKVFISRVLHLFNEITNNSDPKIVKKLTEIELEIYERGMKTFRELHDWQERKFDMIRASNTTIKNTKKFKLK